MKISYIEAQVLLAKLSTVQVQSYIKIFFPISIWPFEILPLLRNFFVIKIFDIGGPECT